MTLTVTPAAKSLFRAASKSSGSGQELAGVIGQRGTALPIQLQLARADKHGEPAQPQEPEDAQDPLPYAVGLQKKSGSTRMRFFKGGDFARLMSSKDKRNARATLEAQQYLDGVYRACAVAPAAAPPAFLADVFAESPRKKRRVAFPPLCVNAHTAQPL